MLRLVSFSKYFIALITVSLLLFTGCSKSAIEAAQQGNIQQYFADNFLDRNYTVHLATDNGIDLTSQYNGYTFRMIKGNTYDGVMTATKNSISYTGTWATNADYSKLVITLPTTVAEFIFMVREWKFTHKAVPIMELAPWGTTEPKVLHMERL